jgi:hypothetical protein
MVKSPIVKSSWSSQQIFDHGSSPREEPCLLLPWREFCARGLLWNDGGMILIFDFKIIIWQLRIPDTAIWYSYGIHGTCIDHLWCVVLVKHADVPCIESSQIPIYAWCKWSNQHLSPNKPEEDLSSGILFRAGMDTKKQNTTIFVGFTSLARFFPHGMILL